MERSLWQKNDKKEKSYIVSFIADSRSLFEYVRDKAAATKEMWPSLKTNFSKVGFVSQNHLKEATFNEYKVKNWKTMRRIVMKIGLQTKAKCYSGDDEHAFS